MYRETELSKPPVQQELKQGHPLDSKDNNYVLTITWLALTRQTLLVKTVVSYLEQRVRQFSLASPSTNPIIYYNDSCHELIRVYT